MKICTIVGARPQFIKAAALSRVLRKSHQEVLIHTGQHFDANMSDIFFKELAIPKPDYNLGIAGGPHGKMTGEMLIAIEQVLLQEKPEMVLVYGDTNSTLAGALAAVKLHIPVCHIEAGVRMETLLNPEEVNRVLTDRISTMHMCCTATAIENLRREGITASVSNPGDLMYDAVCYYKQNLSPPRGGDIVDFAGQSVTIPKHYYLLTCHREENTGTSAPLKEIFTAMQSLDAPTVYPVHPRNRKGAQELYDTGAFPNIILTQPVGYLASLWLIQHCTKVVTDSGGLQREAWFLDKPCVTLLDNAPWPETLAGNLNQLCQPIATEIAKKLSVDTDFTTKVNQFGEGNAAQKIVELITQYERL